MLQYWFHSEKNITQALGKKWEIPVGTVRPRISVSSVSQAEKQTNLK